MPWMPSGITEYAGHVRTFSREMRLYILATLISFLSIGVFQVLYQPVSEMGLGCARTTSARTTP